MWAHARKISEICGESLQILLQRRAVRHTRVGREKHSLKVPVIGSCCRKVSSGSAPFSRGVKRQQRNNVGLMSDLAEYSYLRDAISENLMGRLLDINKTFPLALDLGCWSGNNYNALSKLPHFGGVQTMIEYDTAGEVVREMYMEDTLLNLPRAMSSDLSVVRVLGDEEHLPFPPDTFDLVVSSMNLHWVNDLGGVMKQVAQCLKPDGVFLGAMLGGETLKELIGSFVMAEQERDGGVSPHWSPMVSVSDCGNLLQSVGLALPTVDTDWITVDVDDPFKLMQHLQLMGENSANSWRRPFVSKETMVAAAIAYQEMYGNEDGSVPATFQIVYLIGWKPDKSQPRPLQRGSAQDSLSRGLSDRSS